MMKTFKIYLAICSVIILIYSCKKEDALKFEELSEIRFSHRLLDDVPLTIKVDGKLFEDKGLTGLNSQATFSLKSGNHSFVFYDASGQVVLDTTLSVTGTLAQFDLFRPDAVTPVVFLNEKTLGLDTEPAPKPGYFKIKMANFTADSMDVIFSVIDQNYVKIPLDTIINVKKDFSDFYEIPIPTEMNGEPVNPSAYTFDVFDRTYQVNYGDVGIFVDLIRIQPIQPGKIYVAYMVGGGILGGFSLEKLYVK